MRRANNTEFLPILSSDSVPTVSDIKKLFRGLIVKRNIVNFVRVILSMHSGSLLGVGNRPSRFNSSSQIRKKFSGMNTQFIYGAQTIDAALYETIVRGRFDINPLRKILPDDYNDSSVVTFSNGDNQLLNLLDLTKGKATCYGVPTDVLRSSDHTEGQHFSQFVFENMLEVDGFIYSSRFTEEECVALYHNRVISRLCATSTVPLNKDIVKYAMLSKNVQVQ